MFSNPFEYFKLLTMKLSKILKGQPFPPLNFQKLNFIYLIQITFTFSLKSFTSHRTSSVSCTSE